MDELLERHSAPVALEFLRYFPGLVIEGARQVGKSTLAAQIADADAVVMNLDREQVRAAAAADAEGFIAQAGSRQMVIDEIQRLPELTLAVKAAIDEDRRPGRFILTGSSSLLRVRGTADSLAGRVARLPMYGLSRGEEAGTRDDFLAAVLESMDELPEFSSGKERADYARIMAVGAYPEIRDAPTRIGTVWRNSYLRGIVERDLPELRREIQPSRAMAVLRTLAGRQSSELVKARLAADTTVPASTITRYLDLLHDVDLVASVPPWTPNLAKREVGRPKTFVIDSGLAMQLARLTADQLVEITYGEAYGAMLEGFVTAELMRQRTWSAREFSIFHYRDRAGHEVDLVLELDDGSLIGLEVKSSRSFSAKHFTGLARLRDQLGDRFVAGIVLNTGSAGYRYSDRLYGAPIAALWEFSGH